MKTPARKLIEAAERQALERSMYQQLTNYLRHKGLDWRVQYEFLEGRKYRADFAELRHRLIVEVQGGSWINGAHNRSIGYEQNCVRQAEAAIAGWTMLYATADMVNDGRALALVDRWLHAQAQRRAA